MTSTEVLRRQHDEILKAAGEIGLLLNEDRLTSDGGRIRGLLAKLAGQVGVHLAIEDNAIYPELLSHQDQTVQAMAREFVAEMGGIRAAFTSYTERWPSGSSIQSNPSGFIQETKSIFAALSARIERENTELYVLVDKLNR